ncbi:MAG: hypothetical protein ACKOHK_01755, partial [Planctomycetia bacterium]
MTLLQWLTFACTTAACLCAGLVAADEPVAIEVYPPAIQLDSSRDSQQLVVQAKLADGRTIDVTSLATIGLSDPKLAAVEKPAEGSGRVTLRPLADGDGSVRVSHAGHGRTIPLRVVSATSEPPLSFRLDVMPVFARGGCNMGSCHGAARGKDGFRLSLFGFDPAGDYHRITRELPGRRIDLGNPQASLLLLKATGAVPHTGGKRFTADSDLAGRIERWIAAGAPDDPGPDPANSVPALVALDLYPPQALLEAGAESGGLPRLPADPLPVARGVEPHPRRKRLD